MTARIPLILEKARCHRPRLQRPRRGLVIQVAKLREYLCGGYASLLTTPSAFFLMLRPVGLALGGGHPYQGTAPVSPLFESGEVPNCFGLDAGQLGYSLERRRKAIKPTLGNSPFRRATTSDNRRNTCERKNECERLWP
jgi:hypothetical protein